MSEAHGGGEKQKKTKHAYAVIVGKPNGKMTL